jgi:hypothetical protein
MLYGICDVREVPINYSVRDAEPLRNGAVRIAAE